MDATDRYAAIGQASWQFTDQISATLCLRYTYESKDYFRTTSTFSNLAALNGTFEYPDDESWDALTPSTCGPTRSAARTRWPTVACG